MLLCSNADECAQQFAESTEYLMDTVSAVNLIRRASETHSVSFAVYTCWFCYGSEYPREDSEEHHKLRGTTWPFESGCGCRHTSLCNEASSPGISGRVCGSPQAHG
jgi:hypothetical protein